MKSGKANAIWIGAAAFVAIVCLAGGSVIISTFATRIQKNVDDRKKENEANSAIEANVRDVLAGKQLGQRPNFPDTGIGRMQGAAYDYMELQLARQTTFNKELAAIKFDWVMTPDSLRSEKNLDECLVRLSRARELADWFYNGLSADLEKTIAKMKESAGDDKGAKGFVEGFEIGAKKPGGGNDINQKVAAALKRNHDALEGCLKTLKANSGKFTVDDDGAVTFQEGTSAEVIDEYNRFVQATTDTMAEITRLETKRTQLINDGLANLPK